MHTIISDNPDESVTVTITLRGFADLKAFLNAYGYLPTTDNVSLCYNDLCARYARADKLRIAELSKIEANNEW